MHYFKMLTAVACAFAISGCDKEDPAQLAADGKATGAACRHAGRAIEDCFSLNPDALRGAVFDGWKEMNDYMRENKLAEVKPEQKPTPHDEAHADSSHGEATAEKHAEAGDGASQEAGAEATKVAAAEHAAEAHASEGGAQTPAEEQHAEQAGDGEKAAPEKKEH